MRIKNLRIESFGKLESVSIGLDEKITVIHGKNEAGKSSIASFIKYMLYGFDSTKKADVSENMKKKYMPWDSNECSGGMTFVSSDGKMYTAVRKTASRSQHTVFDENEIPFTSDNAGDVFLGVNENAYKKTAFIGQKEASFTDDGELDSAIRNMVFSADESVDSKKALKKLEDIRKFYLGKAGRTGAIIDLEKELSDLCEQRDKWKDGHKELLGAEFNLAETKKKIEENKKGKLAAEKEKENLDCFEAKKTLDRIDEARKNFESSENAFNEHYKKMQKGMFVPDAEFVNLVKNVLNELEEQKERVCEARNNLERSRQNLESVYADETQRCVFDKLSDEGKTASLLVSEIEEIRKRQKSAKRLAIVLTCLIVTLPIAVIFYIKASKCAKELFAVAERYSCHSIEMLEKILSGGESYKNIVETARRYNQDAKAVFENSEKVLADTEISLNALCQKGGFERENAEEYVSDALLWLDESEKLKSKCRENHVAYNTLVSSVNTEELAEKAAKFDDSVEVRDMKLVLQKLAFHTQAIDALTERERNLEKNTAVLSNTLPKPSEIQSRILSLTEQLDEMKQKHEALSLAIETLEKASENMRSEAAPKIASHTSELFSEITNGKYKALYADSEMNLTFLENGQAEVRDAGYLSAGTLDAAYISLRVALCEFLYKEHPTLIFDDAFANMDDERLGNTLGFLEKLSDDFQIIILSCHDREMKYFDGKAKIINFEV